MRAAESQTDRHLVVEFSGVVFSTVGVGVTVSCRGARHYGVVAVAVVVVVIVLVLVLIIIVVVVVVVSSVVVAAVFFVVLVLPVFTPPIVVVVLRLVVVVAAAAAAAAAVVNSRRVSHGCRSPGEGSAVLLVWWYRGCETPSVRVVQLAWSSDLVTRPAKGVGGVPFVGQRERAIEQDRREEERDRYS